MYVIFLPLFENHTSATQTMKEKKETIFLSPWQVDKYSSDDKAGGISEKLRKGALQKDKAPFLSSLSSWPGSGNRLTGTLTIT